ncbi:MAG: opacity protein-like surface antigen [Chlamydiales bacterium]|jgi:opacity protein-like surface antigen
MLNFKKLLIACLCTVFSFATHGLCAEKVGFDRELAQVESDDGDYEDDEEEGEEEYKFKGFNREDFYAGFLGGYNHLTNSTTNYKTTTTPPTAIDADEQFDDTGFAGAIFLGYHLEKDWRLELELGYRKNTLDKVLIENTGEQNGENGELNSQYAVVSVYYDYTLDDIDITPYFGAGIGVSRVSYKNENMYSTLIEVDDKRMVYTYQYVLGASYPITEKTTFFVDYRYFATRDPKFSDVAGTKVEFENINHVGNLGFRFNF